MMHPGARRTGEAFTLIERLMVTAIDTIPAAVAPGNPATARFDREESVADPRVFFCPLVSM